MRIALISPYSSGPMRGNITTVRRIVRFLDKAGIETLNSAPDRLSVIEMERQLEEFQPDLIHCFHARYCGAISRRLAEHFQLPYIITSTGSDIHDPSLRNHPETIQAIGSAQAVVCFHNSDADKLVNYFPRLGGRVVVVPQGVEQLPVDTSENFGLAHDAFVLLLPAALRPVKRVEFPLQILSQLIHDIPLLHLIIAGGVIDQDYAAMIRNILCDTPFSRWPGEVPHERMGNLYSRADLVLNCSYSESMPNTLMEAMALGRPVLAANIPGNQSLIEDGKTGWLYDGENDFRSLVLKLWGDKKLREKTGNSAKDYIMSNFSPQLEADRYISLYRKLI